jgi:hypothetical protein
MENQPKEDDVSGADESARRSRLAEVISGLTSTNSHVVIDGFLGANVSAAARGDLLRLLGSSADAGSDGEMGPFKLGELAGDDGYWTTKVDTSKRSDYIYWLTESELCRSSADETFGGLGEYFRAIGKLGAEISDWSRAQKEPLPFAFSMDSPEEVPPSLSCDRMMLAAYPTSTVSRFTLHVDNPNRNGRLLTCTYYLNPGWDSTRWGGQLRIVVPGSDDVLVEPLMDRLVIFFADARVPHEVLPTVPSPDAPPYRLSVSLWFSYVSPKQIVETFKGSFATWIAAIKRRKEEQRSKQE